MKKPIFYGCGTAIATPFDDSLKINYSVLKKFLDFQIDNKVDAIIVCGTTGESATLSTEEKKELIKFTCDYVSKRVPVIAGTGSNNTLACIELSKFAQSVGVDGLLIVTPYYNKTTQKGLIEHYSQIAQSVSIPIIMYNVPSRTGLNIEPSTCLELSKIDNIVAIKRLLEIYHKLQKFLLYVEIAYISIQEMMTKFCLYFQLAELVLFQFYQI